MAPFGSGGGGGGCPEADRDKDFSVCHFSGRLCLATRSRPSGNQTECVFRQLLLGVTRAPTLANTGRQESPDPRGKGGRVPGGHNGLCQVGKPRSKERQEPAAEVGGLL